MRGECLRVVVETRKRGIERVNPKMGEIVVPLCILDKIRVSAPNRYGLRFGFK